MEPPENAIIAATHASGETILKNCAIEPEIFDLIKFLKNQGSNIIYSKLRNVQNIWQKIKLNLSHTLVIFDRIELGTYIIAAAISGSKVIFPKINPKIISTEISVLKKMGVKIKVIKDKIVVFKIREYKKINI